MVKGEKYRISVLTDRLVRLEYNKQGKFVDEPTQAIVNRSLPSTEYSVLEENGNVLIDTGALLIKYDKKEFSSLGLSINVKSSGNTWNYSIVHGNSDRNLFGTARTLDGADGSIWLDNGIFGEKGFAVLDDSSSLINVDGEFIPRESEGIDIYFFGYDKDYRGGLNDYFAISGRPPMIPRYALGNWWSRYYRYTQDGYIELLDRLKEENIPLSVAVLDMDWHLTEVDQKYGTGWTGHTWNKELFPDYRGFLKGLKDRGLAVTLNLHPADGIRGFEEQYDRVADRLGLDKESEETAEFDFENKDFRDAYFEEVMHPYEDDGVDFWWIDWQQGTKGKSGNADPLFLLNYYHFHDKERNGQRPMIFSRYAGIGSHRYPIGFSGDTITTWRSLAFQPYFTSTASNIGYGFWSHDIGGHMMGDKDEERLIRWIQFGVFSPIMRLHSSNSPFFNKEPWNVSLPYRNIMGDFMRLRHRLIPYLYTMNYLSYSKGQMLVEPVYYREPDDPEAYRVPNEYFFGNNLLVGAITSKQDAEFRLARVNMLIPEGRWVDIFNGRIYNGRQKKNLYRKVSEIPVLIPAGGIVPLATDVLENGVENPKDLQILVGAGADGAFTLYEDDGISTGYKEGKCVTTTFTTRTLTDGTVEVRIARPEGDLSLIPAVRDYEIVLYGVDVVDEADMEPQFIHDPKMHTVKTTVSGIAASEEAKITFRGLTLAQNDFREVVFDILENAWCETAVKESAYNAALNAADSSEYYTWVSESDINANLAEALKEVLDRRKI